LRKINCFLIIVLVIVSKVSLADSLGFGPVPDAPQSKPGLVAVDYPPDFSYPYAARRPRFSGVVGPVVDQVYPKGYRSLIDGRSYADMFGTSNLTLVGLQAGIKANFNFGAVGLGLGVATGEIKRDFTSKSVTLQATRYQGELNLWFDHIWQEPYFVPTFSVNLKQFSLEEADKVKEVNDTSDLHWGFEVGALVQLNWLDRRTATRNMVRYGMLNSYLGVFWGQSLGAEAPKSMASNREMSAKFLLEF
jgi:hypothetical protein